MKVISGGLCFLAEFQEMIEIMRLNFSGSIKYKLL